MSLVELTEYLVKNLVTDPERVSVKQIDDSDETILIEVIVNNDDMGLVIGKSGKIANSIRTIVQAASYVKDNKKIKINIDSI
ncbi:MAG: KH domain-containing protein [Bacilli bacterium]|nr:KH domain-containing protein [Bacilli bacterium]